MTKQLKKILYLLLGLSAGGIVWFLTEIQLLGEGGSFFLRLFLQGGGIGAAYGLVLGMGEGIALSIRRKILDGALLGLLLGFAGGVASILAAQSVLLYLTGSGSASVHDITGAYLPAARIIGWTLMGGVIGSLEGIRSKSVRRLLFGVAGGVLGGVLGGSVYELLRGADVGSSLQRLLGFCALGLFMGGGLSAADAGGRFGIIKVMNGVFKGKEFILSKKQTLIGSTMRCDVILPGDRGVAPVHARILRRDKSLYIEKQSENKALFVNDARKDSARLKYDDIIRCGRTVLRFIP
jgi:Inner membrane component of T3SS, cytoplasmic domain